MVQVVIPDYSQTAANAFANGRDQARQQAVQHALSMASTDPQGAKNALIAAGEIGAANQIDGIQRQQKLDTTRATAQQQYAAGNVKGARDTAVMGGDPQLADALSKLHDDDLADNDRKMNIVGGFLSTLADVPDVNQRKALVQQYRVPLSQQTGIPLDAIDSYDVSDQGLKAGIAQSVGMTKALEYEKARREANKPIAGAPGQVFFDPNTHQPIPGMSVPEKPDKPTYQKVTDPVTGKESIIQLGGGQQAPTPPAATGKFDSFYSGFLAPHEGGYTPSDGNGAPANMGVNQKANPDVDVASLSPDQAKQIMHDRYWVPSGADKLPPGLAEIQGDTAVNMGVGTAQQLLQQSGGDPQKYLQLREARFRSIAQNDPTKADKLPGWLQRNQQLGQYVSGAGASAPASAAAGPARVVYTTGGGAEEANANLTGDEFLKTLPTPRARMIQQMANGEIPIPTGRAATSGPGMKLVQDVMQYDPTANTLNLQTRLATRKDFASGGKNGQNVKAINTVAGHVADLANAIDDLHNTDFQWANGPVNAMVAGAGNKQKQAALASFNAYKTMVANELTTVYRGTGGAEADIQGWLKQLDTANTPESLRSTVKAIANGLQSRIDALQQSYDHGMDREGGKIPNLTPATLASLQQLQATGSLGASPAGGRPPLASFHR